VAGKSKNKRNKQKPKTLFSCFVNAEACGIFWQFAAPPILKLLPSPSMTAQREKRVKKKKRKKEKKKKKKKKKEKKEKKKKKRERHCNYYCHHSSEMTTVYQHVCSKPPSQCLLNTKFLLQSATYYREFGIESTTPFVRNTLSPPKWKERAIVPWGG